MTIVILDHLKMEGVTATGATGTGKQVFDTSPILVTPNLGTPSAGVLTSCTGLPIAGGGTGQTTAYAAKDALTIKGADIASATTTDLSAATGEIVFVTGTTTITGLGTAAAGVERVVKFAGALTLTHNATSLILPGGVNITTVATDVAMFRSLGSGNWICTSYSPATVSGTGAGLRQVSPSLTTPNIGAATGTSLAFGSGSDVSRFQLYNDGTYVSGFGVGTLETMRIFGDAFNKLLTFGYQTLGGVFTEGMRLVDGRLGIGGTPNANAILDLQSTTKPFMPPRMTTTQRDAVSSPAKGMLIFNTTTSKLNVYTTTWEAVTSA